MLELQDKLSDILENLNIKYTGFVTDNLVVSTLMDIYPDFNDIYGSIKRSVYAEKLSFAKNTLLLYIPTIWVKGQRYKISAFVYFEFKAGVLNKVYIKPNVFSYVSPFGVTQNFISFIEMNSVIKDDMKIRTIESLGVLSNA